MADAKIISYGKDIGAGTTVIPDNQVAVNVESTDAEKYITLDTTDDASKVVLLGTHTEADNESSGMVGIREATPKAPLHIVGTGGSTGMSIDPTQNYSPTVFIAPQFFQTMVCRFRFLLSAANTSASQPADLSRCESTTTTKWESAKIHRLVLTAARCTSKQGTVLRAQCMLTLMSL